MRTIPMLLVVLLSAFSAGAQQHHFTRADTLRGSITPQRAWWDVTTYDLHVHVSPVDSSFSGFNTITYKVLKPDTVMQIDLQMPMEIDSVVQDKMALSFERQGNAFFIRVKAIQEKDKHKKITVN